MIAVVLCAGYATRMYPLTENFPKPLLPVADKPVLDYLLDQIAMFDGMTRIHVVTNDRFIGVFEQWRRAAHYPFDIVLHNDGSTTNDNRLGALADLMLALKTESAPCRVFAAAGDNIFRFPLAPLWESFARGAEHCVVGLHEPDIAKLRKTGVIELTDNGIVRRMHEKPANPPSTLACPPLYFLQPSAWKCLSDFLDDPAQNGDAPGYFVDFLCHREPVRVLQTAGTRLDIGSVETYREADLLLRADQGL